MATIILSEWRDYKGWQFIVCYPYSPDNMKFTFKIIDCKENL